MFTTASLYPSRYALGTKNVMTKVADAEGKNDDKKPTTKNCRRKLLPAKDPACLLRTYLDTNVR